MMPDSEHAFMNGGAVGQIGKVDGPLQRLLYCSCRNSEDRGAVDIENGGEVPRPYSKAGWGV